MSFKYIHNLSESGFWFDRKFVPELREHLRKIKNGDARVLDFGCGRKPYSDLFSGFNGKCFGVDVYPGPRVDVLYDGRKLPIKEGAMDLVFSSSVMEHVEDLPQALREIFRILKPGGVMISVVPFFTPIHGSPFDFHRLTRFGWASILRDVFGDVPFEIEPVDSRLNCVVNQVTGQMNFLVYDILRGIFRIAQGNPKQITIRSGGASPEGKPGVSLRMAYLLVKLNPINFLLGLISWLISWFWVSRGPEGEITSGYLIKVRKAIQGS